MIFHEWFISSKQEYNQKSINIINENPKSLPCTSGSEDGNVSHEASFTILKKDKIHARNVILKG